VTAAPVLAPLEDYWSLGCLANRPLVGVAMECPKARPAAANVLAMSCKARLVISALNYPLGRALAAPWRG